VYKENKTQNYDPAGITYHTPFSVTSFSVNHNKTHKSRLEYEIKYDMCKIGQKIL